MRSKGAVLSSLAALIVGAQAAPPAAPAALEGAATAQIDARWNAVLPEITALRAQFQLKTYTNPWDGKLLLIALLALSPVEWSLAQDAAAELKALEAEYDKAIDALFDAIEKVKDEKERDKQFREKHPGRTFGLRFGDLARRARGSEPGFKAGMQIVRDAWFLEDEASLRAILEDMASSYKGSSLLEQMMPYAAGAAVCKRWSWGEALIRSMTKEETRPLRAAALYNLGTVLRLHGTPEQRAEGLLLFKEIQRDYADLPHARQVEGFFFEQEHLQIGKTAPDFEATDQDGQKFRLSDYRGKVVVIDFWGFW